MGAKKVRKQVRVLDSVKGRPSWASNHIGEVFLVENVPKSNWYVVVENGVKTDHLLRRQDCEVIKEELV